MDVVVGLDTGTTSTKAVVASADGRVRGVSGAAYELLVPGPGRAEQDPRRLRSAAVQALTDAAAGCRERGDRVVAVCLSSAMHGLVPLAADGEPLGPLLTWADTSAAAQAEELRPGAAALQGRTGTPVHPMSPLVKLRAAEPGLRRSTPWWGGVKELVLSALCDAGRVVDLSSVSSSGLYDLRASRWDPEALALAGVRADQLAEVVPTTQVVGVLRPELGLGAVPVVAGATDGVLATLGCGAVARGTAAVTLGTSGALRFVVPEPYSGPQERLFCYALTEDLWVLGGAVSNGGSVLTWARSALGEDDVEVLLAEAAAVPAGSDGLVCLPYLLGERAPWWRADVAGGYLGLRRDHGRGHLVRAAVEGVCQQLALVRDDCPVPLREVRATGGAFGSPLWAQVLAAALDLPLRTTLSTEGTGLGACLLGWHAAGALPDLAAASELVQLAPAVPPDPAAAARYAQTRPQVERAALAVTALMRAVRDAQGPGAT